MLWETQATQTLLTHGFELGRARVGLDFRTGPQVSIGPVIGADLNVLLWESSDANRAIPNPTLSTFVFAGLQGRMDFGGSAAAPAPAAPADP